MTLLRSRCRDAATVQRTAEHENGRPARLAAAAGRGDAQWTGVSADGSIADGVDSW